MYNLFTFHNTHSAIFMEKLAQNAGLSLKLIPVPRSISASCGLAARINEEDLDALLNIIRESEIGAAGAFFMDSQGNIREMPPDIIQ